MSECKSHEGSNFDESGFCFICDKTYSQVLEENNKEIEELRKFKQDALEIIKEACWCDNRCPCNACEFLKGQEEGK